MCLVLSCIINGGGAGKGLAEEAVVDHLGVVCWNFSLLMRL